MRNRYALAAFAVVAVALVVATVVTLRSGGGGPPLAGRLGPTPGPDSEGHIAAKSAYLEALARREPDAAGAGLVSFSRLLAAAEASSLLGDLRVSAAFVSFPVADPEAVAVEDTLEAAVALRADELARVTMAEIEALERSGGDPDLLEQRRAALAATARDCPCVYAVAVEGATVARLAALQRLEEVRLVDVPDPLTDTLRGWELTPVFPSGSPA